MLISTSAAPALSVRGLCKNFDGKQAVDGLDLTIRPGEFYALLGPNGAGKTTTIRMAAGLLLPDSGTIEVYGVDVQRQPVDAKRITAWILARHEAEGGFGWRPHPRPPVAPAG